MNDVQQAQLWQALQSPPPEGGLWNGQKVANWMSELLGHSVSRQRVWEYLKAMRLRLRVARPSHQEADFTEQEQWKKTSKNGHSSSRKVRRRRCRSLDNG